MLTIDSTKLKIFKQELTPKFKEELSKTFLQNDLVKLNIGLRSALNKSSTVDLALALKELKKVSQNFYFNGVSSKCDEWIQIVNRSKNFQDLNVSQESIDFLLNAMGEEGKRILVCDSPYYTGYSRLKKPEDTQNTMKSPGLNKRVLNASQKSVVSPMINVIVKDDEQLFQELKPIKFDGLYRKDMTNDEIEAEIAWLTQENKSETQSKGHGRAIKINNNNSIIDCSYPFKRESFNCLIF